MLTPIETVTASAHAAIVARPALQGDKPDGYLRLDAHGQPNWTKDPADATAFVSMREAARAAFRLPAGLRAYGLPRSLELSLAHAH
jgi:hypothetical protein